MQAEHTPGPWGTDETDHDAPYQDIVIRSGNRNIAKLWQDDAPVVEYNNEQAANARLIVAAPAYFDAAHWIGIAVTNNAAPVNPLIALEELALDGKHVTLDAGLVLDLLTAHAKATGGAA